MKAYELVNGESLNALKIVDRPDPVPGPMDVVIDVKACSLNYRDVLIAKGRTPHLGAPAALSRFPMVQVL